MFQDKELTCRDCGNEFIFSASEQQFYEEKGFNNEPGRCPDCRAARKAANNRGGGYSRQARKMYTTTCSECGNEAEVPFQPSGDRPVYCRDCFRARN